MFNQPPHRHRLLSLRPRPRFAPALLLFLSFLSFLSFLAFRAPVRAQDTRPSDRVRTTIEQAIAWIARQAVPVAGARDAVLFRDTAEARAEPSAPLYGGTAGVLLFLENAAAVLDDARARALADATARGLLAARRNDDEGRVTWTRKGMSQGAAALYVGDAGVGHAFLVRARLRNDAAALATAVAAGDSLLARAWKGGDELHWDRQVEIIYGAAGTALFLLELGAETGERRFQDAALGAARWLIQESKTTPSRADPKKTLRSWRWALAGNRHMPNFSHGTAGVAYALAHASSPVAAATRA